MPTINGLYKYSLVALDVLLKPDKSLQLPRHIQVEVTTFCNLDCLSCGRRHLVKKPKHMAFEALKRIYDEIEPTNINLSGLGEPLLNPDIFKMIRYCKERGAIVNFPTNLNVPLQRIEKLVEAGPQQIKISIDAATPETYKVVRQKDSFQRVLENMRLINSLKNEGQTPYPEIRFNFALQKENIHELPQLLELASELEVGTVYIQDLNYFSVEDEKEKLCGIDRGYLEEILRQCEKIAQQKRIETNIRNWKRHFDPLYNKMLPETEFEPNTISCNFPWVSSFIDVHGNVKPCPVFVWEEESLSLGNCLEDPFEQIWNGEEYRYLRHSFKKKNRECEICKRCVPPDLFDMKLIFQKMILRS